jgi:hypothetical protein
VRVSVVDRGQPFFWVDSYSASAALISSFIGPSAVFSIASRWTRAASTASPLREWTRASVSRIEPS